MILVKIAIFDLTGPQPTHLETELNSLTIQIEF